MPRPLDEIDLRILEELRINSRISHAKLGEIVRLSRNATRQRIERLERDGYIRGYTIKEGVTGGPSRVRATLLVYRENRMRDNDVIATLNRIPEVIHCDVVTGELDLIVFVEAETQDRVREIWQRLASLPGVRDITTAMALRTVIDRHP
jgi:DNA-binding Lrp family transcriptional regulator